MSYILSLNISIRPPTYRPPTIDMSKYRCKPVPPRCDPPRDRVDIGDRFCRPPKPYCRPRPYCRPDVSFCLPDIPKCDPRPICPPEPPVCDPHSVGSSKGSKGKVSSKKSKGSKVRSKKSGKASKVSSKKSRSVGSKGSKSNGSKRSGGSKKSSIPRWYTRQAACHKVVTR